MEQSRSLLVIDDDAISAEILLELLGAQFETRHVGIGADGLRVATETVPSIILLDVEMPGMDGYEVCRALRAEVATKDVPVIFLSAHGSADDRLKGYQAGGDDYIVKPFNPDELQKKSGLFCANPYAMPS